MSSETHKTHLNASHAKQWLQKQLHKVGDIEERELKNQEDHALLLYFKSMCDPVVVNEDLINRFYELNSLKIYEEFIRSFPSTIEPAEESELMRNMLRGCVVVFIQDRVLLFDAVLINAGDIQPASTENVIQGPDDSFTENIEVNLNLIRHRYQTANLKSEFMTVGKISQTRIIILYDVTKADESVLEELRKRLSELKSDIVQSASEIERHTMHPQLRLFPTLMLTERPDRTVMNISQGKVAVLVDSTGYAILLPAIFNDFFTAMDDKIQLPPIGWFLKGIRYIALFVTVLMPSLYVAFTSYNPEILKMQITLLIAGSRATVPYPSFFEVIFMLLAMGFLTEASVRLPKAIGQTACVVGGLILGTAATEAGLVSNIMIILVAAVAVTNFVIPINMMSSGIRVTKYIFILLATFFGLVGIVLGVVATIMYLTSLRSFGKPYLKMFAVEWSNKGDQQSG
ncbi:spore germination protein [Paenibacillus glucanolyticus]|jgi:spore germination protein|uniref:spore germination protein n=1 Tax=Paenibacillus glucanolyticus TaxID=59843 RepID=UPI000D1B2CAE|nr:spore germination protein [Paenibacillus glucanolyticus]AVV56080.1 spore germination protein [Paenibacillus glucanolyticus]